MKFGLKHWLIGIDYTRYLEYPLALRCLEAREGSKILDIGTGWYSTFPIFLAEKGAQVYTTDISDHVVKKQLRTITEGRFSYLLKEKRLFVEKEDARALSYPANSFDRVLAISSIEHIREDGDIKAVLEIARVLRPGGRSVITVPFSQEFQENETSPWVRYFNRRYNDTAIEARLIRPSRLKVLRLYYFGEDGFNFGRYWWKIPFYLRAPFYPFLPIATILFLHLLNDKDRTRAGGACLVLAKV